MVRRIIRLREPIAARADHCTSWSIGRLVVPADQAAMSSLWPISRRRRLSG